MTILTILILIYLGGIAPGYRYGKKTVLSLVENTDMIQWDRGDRCIMLVLSLASWVLVLVHLCIHYRIFTSTKPAKW